MKTLYLHIGMDKTGTSAIQKFLVLNSSLLCHEFNLHYIKTAQSHDFAHNDLAYAIFEQNGFSESDLNKFLNKISNEVMNVDSGTFIISSECLFKSYTQDNFNKFLHLLNKYFDEIKVIVYLRNQLDWIISRHKHSITSGSTIEVETLMKPWFSDYTQHIIEWSKFFDKENIILRNYDRNSFVDKSIYSDFISCLGIESKEEFVHPKGITNESLDRDCIEIKKLINQTDMCIKDRNRYNKYLFAVSKKSNGGFYLTSGQAKRLKNEYYLSNKILLDEFGLNGVLTISDNFGEVDYYVSKDKVLAFLSLLGKAELFDLKKHIRKLKENNIIKEVIIDFKNDIFSNFLRNRVAFKCNQISSVFQDWSCFKHRILSILKKRFRFKR